MSLKEMSVTDPSASQPSTANILWFLPTHGDGRHLGTTEGGREVNFNYLRQIAQATVHRARWNG